MFDILEKNYSQSCAALTLYTGQLCPHISDEQHKIGFTSFDHCKIQHYTFKMPDGASHSSSMYRISSMSPAASLMLCHALQSPHCTKTVPLSHAMGFTIRDVLLPVLSKQQHEFLQLYDPFTEIITPQ